MPSLPEDSDFSHYQSIYRERAANQFTSLEKRRTSGAISTAEYNSQLAELEAKVTADAHSALLRHHQLAGQRSPEPDAGVSTSIRGASQSR